MKFATAITAATLAWVVGASAFAFDIEPYRRAAEGATVTVDRGVSFANDELEATRTEGYSFGLRFAGDKLTLAVPFESYTVDTRGDGALPLGTLDATVVGVGLFWQPRRAAGWSPYFGVGAQFTSFDEMFAAVPANVQNAFGGEGHAGIRIRLLDNILDAARLQGSIGYRFSVLEPRVRIPDNPAVERVSFSRHSALFNLELSTLTEGFKPSASRENGD